MQILDWQQLDAAARAAALARPAAALQARTLTQARSIIDAVRAEGDAAVRRHTRSFDGIELGDLAVSATEFAAAHARLQPDQLAALQRAIANVDAFHRAALP